MACAISSASRCRVPREMLLDIRNLHVSFTGYRGHSRVLNGVNLTVGRGEKVGLVGETGCGKSLTVRAVLGLLQPPRARIRGEIWFAGRNLLPCRPENCSRSAAARSR